MQKILIVEDDMGIQTQLKWALSAEYSLSFASNRVEALEGVSDGHRVVLLDLGLPPHEDGATEGLAALEEILTRQPGIKVIVMTGNEDREVALRSILLGAYDFYQKPVNIEELKVMIKRACHVYTLERENSTLRHAVLKGQSFENILGQCSGMQAVFQTIRKVASTDATVLIIGDSGTGKELVAQAIHYQSTRKNGPLVTINCGGIPDSLLESELFGYEKGAFTDAKSRKIGLIEKASGGTLFLDEAGELPMPLQVKLLRVLQERQIQRLGGTEPIDVDMRVLAATNLNLEASVKSGRFREDLYYRLSVIQIRVPRLRERGEDLSLLGQHFFHHFCEVNHRKLKGFSQEALATMKSHPWPGNVRELENRIQRAVIMADGPEISGSDLGFGSDELSGQVGRAEAKTLREIRANAEIQAVHIALAAHHGNISRAARELDLSRPTLHAMIKKYGVTVGGGALDDDE